MMNSPFFEKSKEIANNFLQSIVFIDDEAYPTKKMEDSAHEFDALKISKAFALKEKICAVYKAETFEDINNFKSIAKKSDVAILDWKMKNIVNASSDDLEADASDDDIRGVYTKQIIKDILIDDKTGKDSLKLIIIYTGDFTYLSTITDEVYDELKSEVPNLQKNLDEFKIESDNFKILIRSKEVNISHALHLERFVLKHEELPDFILEEFTKMTTGLLSNFALLSLTTLRENSHKILTLFSKDLDSAYLSHKSFVPNSEDAEDLLLEILKDSIADLLSYNGIHRIINEELISCWINDNIIDEKHPVLNSKGNKLNPILDFERKKTILIDLLFSTETRVEKKFETIFKTLIADKDQRIEFLKYLSNNNTKLFLNLSEETKEEEINKNFAKLTHHKSLFLPQNIEPKLTLGTIIKSTKNDNYFICIQQKCDSVRIYGAERKFLFLPMSIVKGNDKFDVISPIGIKLKLNKKSFSIRTIKFIGDTDEGIIKGRKNEFGKYIFEQNYKEIGDEHFEWVLDLKDLHSQRIVAEYASQLSRVGLDESEWLRRWAN